MRRLLTILLALSVCFSAAGCGAVAVKPEIPAATEVPATPEPTPVPTAEELYFPIVAKYCAALYNRYDMEQLQTEDLNYMLAYSYGDDPLSSAGFLLADIDADGNAEMLVGSLAGDAYNRQIILDMYTLSDGKPVKVFTAGERDRFYFCSEGFFAEEASNSAMNSAWRYYTYAGGTMTEVKAIVFNAAEDRENPWHLIEGGTESPIAEADATNMISGYQALYVTPEYVPFSQYSEG